MASRAEGSLARFAVESGRFGASTVKPKLFEPNRNLELSVFGIGGLVCAEVRDLGIAVARWHPTARQLHGWGEISEEAVASAELDIEYDNQPERHANITGWPEDIEERKLKQQLLASRAHPVKFDSPIPV